MLQRRGYILLNACARVCAGSCATRCHNQKRKAHNIRKHGGHLWATARLKKSSWSSPTMNKFLLILKYSLLRCFRGSQTRPVKRKTESARASSRRDIYCCTQFLFAIMGFYEYMIHERSALIGSRICLNALRVLLSALSVFTAMGAVKIAPCSVQGFRRKHDMACKAPVCLHREDNDAVFIRP